MSIGLLSTEYTAGASLIRRGSSFIESDHSLPCKFTEIIWPRGFQHCCANVVQWGGYTARPPGNARRDMTGCTARLGGTGKHKSETFRLVLISGLRGTNFVSGKSYAISQHISERIDKLYLSLRPKL